ncbi:gamma-glutamyl-gamma-aminobutyrate hydrolase family protein [Leucobacter viscericola]|uniref:Gamma-glutamyl-gamma-aminobutyrate hydrolase family protein n=1 Tax=Leucobacter viscericola TaxID=2714935 RepID=A0A6G7XIG8_9MICO|nr:gamma-glutamyl-gamma-aminobutyrate hydrolase family protein [Leucobacter viscericola]QIK64312.1 gamma-glutamyl-gamma-aminobutyrate hydrolase family protein [Leucobacter viscericola]
MADVANSGGPLIPMVVSVTFPGIGPAAQQMQDEFTRIAFDAVRLAGGQPRLIDSAAPALANTEDVFAGAAAIVFLGGGDVDTSLYGYTGPPPQNEYGVDRRADEYCIDLIREAVARDLPTLAICRGSQLLNVAFGGTLIPDIEKWEQHRGGSGSPLFIHEDVRLEGDSEIARILGRTEITVRNGHHQAVAEVAPALSATAFAHDGIVEGTQHREASWVLGIQWHPEEPEANVADRERIFGALVERTRGSKP